MQIASFKDTENLKDYFISMGCSLKYVSSPGGEPQDVIIPPNKTWSAYFTCQNCGTEIQKRFSLLLVKDPTDQVFCCRSCGLMQASYSKEDLIDLFAQKGFTLKKELEIEDRRKTKIDVICSRGHDLQVTINNFIRTVRNNTTGCRMCDKVLKNSGEWEKFFREKSLTPVEGSVLSTGETPITCTCDVCGESGDYCLNGVKRRRRRGCDTCNKIASRSEVEEFLKSKGMEVSDCPDFVGNIDMISYGCLCGKTVRQPWRTILKNEKCVDCSSPVSGNYQKSTNYRMMFENQGYVVLDYNHITNVATLFDVRCPEGHIYQTCVNRFRSGHRCPHCVRKINPLKAKQELISCGFQPKETYVDSHTPMKCVCLRCGSNCEVTLSNARNHTVGCSNCYRSYLRSEVVKELEKEGCKLLLPEKGLVTKQTELFYECSCGGHAKSTLKSFLKGGRCESCRVSKITVATHANMNNPTKKKEILNKQVSTSRKNWGVDRPMQSPEVFEKVGHVNFIFPSGRRVKFQSQLEKIFVETLINSGYEEEDIIFTEKEGKSSFEYQIPNEGKKIYHPDFYLRSKDVYVEIKSQYILEKEEEKNKAKFIAVAKQITGELWVIVYDNHKAFVERFIYKRKGNKIVRIRKETPN